VDHHHQAPRGAVPGQVQAEQEAIPAPHRPVQHHGRDAVPVQNQVENEFLYSKKIFAYADDGTVLLKLEYNTLLRVKQILQEFATISGLRCNIEKTFLVQIGSNDDISPEILELGFSITEEITVLGMRLGGKNIDFIAENENTMITKVQNQVTFWDRFNLSLPGRINVAKSLMYSQLNYMGCFLPVCTEKIAEINEIIGTFVKGNLNLSKKRFLMQPEDGGLGLFEVGQFLRAQHCSWIRRALVNIDDYWKHCMWLASEGNILYCNESAFSKERSPVIFNILKGYNDWLPNFWKFNENFRDARIIDNETLSLQRNTNIKITLDFFQDYLPGNKVTVNKLTLSSIHNGDRFVSIDEFVANTGIAISQRKLTALRGVFETAEIRYRKQNTTKKTTNKIRDFMLGIQKGCKKFKLVERQPLTSIPHNIMKFAENTEIVINLEGSKILNKAWNISYLENDLRVFIFKLHNNTLGYNNMVSRFVENIEPFCTFCSLRGEHELEPETPLHIFYSCPYTEPMLEIFNEITRNNATIRRLDIFYKFEDPSVDNTKVMFLIALLFKKYIWDCKLRKSLPNFDELRIYIKAEVKCIHKISTKFRKIFDDSDYGWLLL